MIKYHSCNTNWGLVSCQSLILITQVLVKIPEPAKKMQNAHTRTERKPWLQIRERLPTRKLNLYFIVHCSCEELVCAYKKKNRPSQVVLRCHTRLLTLCCQGCAGAQRTDHDFLSFPREYANFTYK